MVIVCRTHPERVSARTAMAVYCISAVLVAAALVAAIHAASSRSFGTYAAAPVHPAPPTSWLAGTTVLTVYGRGFGVAPVLGRLGLDRGFDDLARQVAPYRRAIQAAQPHRHVRIAVHLIYALAIPCDRISACLLYLDDTGVDIVKDYIEPAARRGWLVILDDQIGRSNPESEMERIIARGYLNYDNVEVAFDPEFRTAPAGMSPGIPVGSVNAAELNAAQQLLGRASGDEHLAHRKLMLVHQWTASMIQDRRALRTDVPDVDPVVVMDGIGAPSEKAQTYDDLVGPGRLPAGLARGIKLFPDSPYSLPGHIDAPVLSWPQLLQMAPATDVNGRQFVILPRPAVIVIT